MRKIISVTALFVLMIICFVACSKGHEDLLQQQNPTGCDTVNVSYQSDVLPIISSNCYSCHGGSSPSSGISLDGYDNIKKHAEDESLVGTISHADGFPAMPENAPMLSACDINTIAAWVNAGSLNN